MAEILKVAASVTTAVVAVCVFCIAWLQWITARNKLRLDLYNRRFDIYERTLDFVNALLVWSEIPEETKRPLRIAFVKAVRESRFLFIDDPRVHALLNEMNDKSFQVSNFYDVASKFMRIAPEEYIDGFEEKDHTLNWITDSLSRLDDLIEPYLAFRRK